MKIVSILLLITTTLTFGQTKEVTCLDLNFQFELFIPQIKNNSRAKKIANLDNYFQDSIYIKVDFSRNVLYDYDIKGIAIDIINTTKKDFLLYNNALLDLLCEVKHEGKWQAIEKNENSWGCISSSLVIPTNSYITAILPCYTGTESVTMRYRFSTGDRVMYSEEFVGAINPGLLK